MIIDCHVHMLSEKNYATKLVAAMDEAGIDMACLLAMQNIPLWGSRAGSNEQVLQACQTYPGRFIPFAWVEMGVDPVSMIDSLFMQGFKGIKITRTKYDYNADIMMPYYERAAVYRMVLLFHTGTVLRVPEDYLLDVDSSRLRPIFLDRIARKYPNLNMIGAHLGNPWYEEAAMTLFWNANVYFDLSGTVLKRKSPAWFKEVLWWFPDTMKKLSRDKNTHYNTNHPFERICFGTDVPTHEMRYCVTEYADLFDALEIPDDIRRRVMGGNIARMIGLHDGQL